MNFKKTLKLLLFSGLLVLLACKSNHPIPELSKVPATTLLHLHLAQGMNSQIRAFAGEQLPGLVLADSLLKKGELGISVVGIDITTLDPQLLLLTRDATPEYATALAARVLNLDPRQEENRIDLVSPEGYAEAAVAEKDDWVALYIGPAPHITIGNWLELEKENSLASDTSLAKVIPEEAHLTLLLSSNLFSFVSLLPLERQIPWWLTYKDIATTVKPAAFSLFLTWPEPDTDDPIQAGTRLARRDGGLTSIDFSISDTQIDTDSIFLLMLGLTDGVSFE